MTEEARYPRGSAGCVLYPETVVRVHGLKSVSGRARNGQEAVCERFDERKGCMIVRFDNGQTKAIPPRNLQKIHRRDTEVEMNPEIMRILAIFQAHDANGDGILDTLEFAHILRALGLPASSVPHYQRFVDKNGDNHISYEEFISWALAPPGSSARAQATQARAQAPRPSAPRVPDLPASMPEPAPGGADSDDEKESGPDHEEDLSLEDIECLVGKGKLGDDWPANGVTIVNNMHERFPEYPLEGIVFMMRRNGYVGGKVLAAIRNTGTPEVEVVPASAVRVGIPGAFPATYRNRRSTEEADGGQLAVYEQSGRDWSFRNMRDGKLRPVEMIRRNYTFEVLEVTRGSEYGFCFGRISGGPPHRWVVLGLECHSNIKGDNRLDTSDLNYSDAERISRDRFG